MLVSKYAVVIWNNSNKKHYVEKGYTFTFIGDTFLAKVEDLTCYSGAIVEYECDICHDSFFTKYANVSKKIKLNKPYSCSRKCAKEIAKQTCLKKYGEEYSSRNKKVKEKASKTYKEHWGKETNPDGYNDLRKRTKETSLKRYNVENPAQSKKIREQISNTKKNFSPEKKENIRQKTNDTCMEKYGKKRTWNLPDVWEKTKTATNYTQKEMGFFKQSKQQIYLHNLLGGEIDFVCGIYILDIMKNNIDIEYDGGGHTLSIKIQNISFDEFYKKEDRRNKYVIEHGFKIIRYVSDKDKLFQDNIILNLFDYCYMYLEQPEHNLIYIDVDKLCIRDSESVLVNLNENGEIIG